MTEDTYKGDPSNPLSLNYYGYVEGNPLKYVDPSGHVAETILLGAFADGPSPIADIFVGATYLGINAFHYGSKALPYIMQFGNKAVEGADQVINGNSGSASPQMDPNDPKWRMPKNGDEINGRFYSKHALERMAPDTVRVRAELEKRVAYDAKKIGISPGTKEYKLLYDKYMNPRGIPVSVVEDTITNGSKVAGNTSDTWVYIRDSVRVVVNKGGDVITVIPK